jgi:hypothetical protein
MRARRRPKVRSLGAFSDVITSGDAAAAVFEEAGGGRDRSASKTADDSPRQVGRARLARTKKQSSMKRGTYRPPARRAVTSPAQPMVARGLLRSPTNLWPPAVHASQLYSRNEHFGDKDGG